MKKLMVAVAAASVALTAAACTNEAAGSTAAKHPTHKTHSAKSRVVTAKAHVSGGAYFLTLKGAKQPASVSKVTFKRCAVGDHYPSCADK